MEFRSIRILAGRPDDGAPLGDLGLDEVLVPGGRDAGVAHNVVNAGSEPMSFVEIEYT